MSRPSDGRKLSMKMAKRGWHQMFFVQVMGEFEGTIQFADAPMGSMHKHVICFKSWNHVKQFLDGKRKLPELRQRVQMV